jgi:uncharacterized protein YgiM (DUF1202 family)
MKMLGLAIVGLLLVPALAVAEPDSYAGEVTASRLQLRAGPGEAYQPVLSLEKGSRFIVIGPHANAPEWLRVEIPGGFEAWVFARFVKRDASGMGELTADRVLVRPRPTTRYHQLVGRLAQGEKLKVVGEKQTEEGLWYRVVVPRRFPLYVNSQYVKNVGDVSLAAAPVLKKPAETKAKETPATTKNPKQGTVILAKTDAEFAKLAASVRVKLTAAKTVAEIEGLRHSVETVDPTTLGRQGQEERLRLLSDLVKAERNAAGREFEAAEKRVLTDLEKRLLIIQREYERRLHQIQIEANRNPRPRYTATGIVRHRPDIVGRYPSFRLEEGDEMRYFLIASDFDLHRFRGKRVGIVGLKDPESGTGFETIIVRRIEILGDK